MVRVAIAAAAALLGCADPDAGVRAKLAEIQPTAERREIMPEVISAEVVAIDGSTITTEWAMRMPPSSLRIPSSHTLPREVESWVLRESPDRSTLCSCTTEGWRCASGWSRGFVMDEPPGRPPEEKCRDRRDLGRLWPDDAPRWIYRWRQGRP